LNYNGFDGVSQIEPGLQPAVAPGGQLKHMLPLRRPGTFFADTRLLGDRLARPSTVFGLVIADDTEPKTDRDELFLVEDWRIDAGGDALAPGKDARNAAPIYTVNRKPSADITLPANGRLRLRIINGCQRAIIALKIADLDVRVMAIDGLPAEPFLARNGQLLIAPGSRIDAFIDAARPAGSISAITLFDGVTATPVGRILVSPEPPIRPAPLPAAPAFSSAGLPTRIDLQSALRADVVLGESAPWVTPVTFSAAGKPAFQAKRGRNVVLTVSNPAKTPGTFHLHGHHFRLLDRLDDGWKPFWLDTLAFDTGQIQRIAFVAEYAGQWLMEFIPSDWSSLRRIQRYTVE
jgi:FtsP/CotA-like multicopper oxidase with cupredoxin domain